ncbi:hypothetical protein F3Y22_tig00012104pilonHSYRG00077 [Hibiscus syriacus]|uniref:Uncharacterized protein n=1 Tax=Hibiscus syriacus TaxID=106335 RepID=A0A6A3C386_HIBSY|nr:hypothetical protein F3Y22_tig00012104pilonHSYRG00077 [Hibiscus syriacus]
MSSSSSLTILNPFPPKSSKIHSNTSLSPPSYRRLVRRGRSFPGAAAASTDFDFALQDALESSGIDTSHARVLLLLLFYCKEETIEATKGFVSQIKELSNMERETSISINRGVDLWKTALYIAAEDDSLVSHSSVPLPVDAFLERLDDLSMGYCFHYNLSCSAYQLASAKAAQHRLEWDVWTREMRDYSILLYHCGLYDQSLKYLKLYQDAKSSSPQRRSTNSISILEEEAVQKLLVRLNLITMENGWSQRHVRNFLGNSSEPW